MANMKYHYPLEKRIRANARAQLQSANRKMVKDPKFRKDTDFMNDLVACVRKCSSGGA